MTSTLHRRGALAGLSTVLATLGRGPSRADPSLSPVVLSAELATEDAAPSGRWIFKGEPAGPILRLRHGQEFRATLRNGTPKPLSLHWHGVRGPAAFDGVGGLSQPPVMPGGSFEYRFTPPDPGTYLVRPLVTGGSSEPSARGLVGMLVVAERDPPPVDQDYALLVRDWLVEPGGALAPFGRTEEAALGGRLGSRMAVGGEDAPRRITLPAGSRVRLRLANGCNARIMRIRFDGMKAFVGAVDGQPTDTFEPLRSSLPFAPGSRYDIFFDVPREAGATSMVTAQLGAGLPLVIFTAGEAASASARADVAAPAPNRLLPPEIFLQNALRRDFAIAGGATRGADGTVAYRGDPARVWTVNGQAGAASAPPLFTTRRGQPVVLAVANGTGFVQPVHLHGHVFRLLHPLDDGWEPYWLDTLQVPEGKTVRVAFMADNPGRWAVSSTVLERFDTGLWGWFEVT